jgi:hypothetical protein
MNFQKIVAFGDSFIWGDELLDPTLKLESTAHPSLVDNTCYREANCFLGQMGAHYGVPTENFGIPGGSLQSTIWTYLWWLEHRAKEVDNCLILVGLTGASRRSFYNPYHLTYANDPPWNKFIHSAWITSESGYEKTWIDTIKQLTVLSDCKALAKLNYQQAVWFFEGQAAIRSNRVFQFCTITPPCLVNVASLLWPEQTLTSMLTDLDSSAELFAKNGHPNEIGHNMIAQLLINHVDSCIINE